MAIHRIIKKDELYHHGILGQKWGQRNGPPYPLGSSDHSKSEKDAGWRQSISKGSSVSSSKKGTGSSKGSSVSSSKKGTGSSKGSSVRSSKQGTGVSKGSSVSKKTKSNSKSSNRNNSSDIRSKKLDEHKEEYGIENTDDKRKEYIKYGLMIAGTALAAYGGYQLYKYAKSEYNKGLGTPVLTFDNLNITKNDAIKNLSNKEQIKAVNKFFSIHKGSDTNCALCTTAFELRKRGYDVAASFTATGFTESEITSWYRKPDGGIPSFKNVYDSSKIDIVKTDNPNRPFDITTSRANKNEKMKILKQELLDQGVGARGNMSVYFGFLGGHSFIYEVVQGRDNKPHVQFMDAQIEKIYDLDDFTNPFYMTTHISYLRTDHLIINENILDKVRYNQDNNLVSKFVEMGSDLIQKLY